MDRPALATALARAVPGLEVIAEPEALRPFETDGSRPSSAAPYRRAAHGGGSGAGRALLPRRGDSRGGSGCRDGAFGGRAAHEAGVLLVLSKLSEILRSTPRGKQPGSSLACAISRFRGRRAYGLFYAPDPSSQIACSISGNVAENAGGVHCLKYGLTVHNLLAVTIVTVEGICLPLVVPRLMRRGWTYSRSSRAPKGSLGWWWR